MFCMQTLVFILAFCFSLQPCTTEGEVVVKSCNFMESCVLPCSFKTGDALLIHWKVKATTGEENVISYDADKVKFNEQAERFRDRASLDVTEISKANASLRLDRVEIQDEGRYECYVSVSTSSSQTYYVDLRVNALPRRVNIQRDGNKITCSAEGIYPSPHLNWFPSTLNVSDEPKVLQTEQHLYNIRGSVVELVDESVDYSCTVSTRSGKRRATLFRPISLNGSNPETKIRCLQNILNASQTGLTWRFNHMEIILTQTTANAPYDPSETWAKHVKNVSETGDLTLENLSSDHDGVYTCERSTADEDYVTNTDLKVKTDSSLHVGSIVAWVLVPFLLISAVVLGAVCFFRRRRPNQRNNNQLPRNNDENEGLNQGNNGL